MILKEVERKDIYVEYDIFDKRRVGILQTVEQPDRIFVRQIHIETPYTRKGYATKAMMEVLSRGVETEICITPHSASAEKFWDYFFEICRQNGYIVENIRGTIWRFCK